MIRGYHTSSSVSPFYLCDCTYNHGHTDCSISSTNNDDNNNNDNAIRDNNHGNNDDYHNSTYGINNKYNDNKDTHILIITT